MAAYAICYCKLQIEMMYFHHDGQRSTRSLDDATRSFCDGRRRPTVEPAVDAAGGSATENERAASAAGIVRSLDTATVSKWHRRLILLIGAGSFFNFVEVALSSLLVPLIGEHWAMNSFQQAALIAATFIGEAIGSTVLSPLADRFGRSRMFQVNLLLYAVLSIVSAFAPSVDALIVLRVLLGIGLGAELTLVDSYLGEMMPARSRGRLVAWSYTLGLLAVPITGAATVFMPAEVGGIAGWRFILGATAFGALIIWLLRRKLPESPRWLIAHGRYDEAQAVIAQLERYGGQPGDRGSVRKKRRAAPVAAAADAGAHLVAVAPVFQPPSKHQLARRRALLIVLNTLGPIAFYGFASIAPLVLIDKGFSVVHSLAFTALSALGYPLGSLICVPIVERFQRRTLLIASSLAVAVFGITFGFAETPVLIVAAGFVTGMASVVQSNVTHIYQAELFPTAIRARSVGRPYALSRVIGALLPFATLPILHALGAGWLYSLCAALIVVLVVLIGLLGPQTNAKSLDTI